MARAVNANAHPRIRTLAAAIRDLPSYRTVSEADVVELATHLDAEAAARQVVASVSSCCHFARDPEVPDEVMASFGFRSDDEPRRAV
jgi:hypothetical protein